MQATPSPATCKSPSTRPCPGKPRADGTKAFAAFIRERYEHPIPTLAPGSNITNIYSNLAPDAETGETDEPVPHQFEVTVAYQDDHQENYTEGYKFNLDALSLTTFAYPGNTEPKKVQGRIARALEIIATGIGRP